VSCFDDSKVECFIVQNKILDNGEKDKPTREMYVYLEENAFSKNTLKMLFKELSKKHSKPWDMDIYVNSDWSVIRKNIEPDAMGYSGGATDRERNYRSAIYFRRADEELFRYNPILKSTDIETVFITGE
jgi:hypothetical protein